MVNLEKDVFLAFYIIRKLMEAHKLSVEVESTPVRLTSYRWTGGRRVTYLNWDKIEDLYDWSGAADEPLSLRDLCNVVVHSYVYVPLMSEDRTLEAILVTSDRSRNQKLFNLDARRTVTLLRAVANDDPDRSEMKLNAATGDYAVRLWHSPTKAATIVGAKRKIPSALRRRSG